MTTLQFKRVRNGTFHRTGDTKLLVDFTKDKTNEEAGDWCPKWAEVEEIVLTAIDVEKENRGGWVNTLERINEHAAQRLPHLPIARVPAIIRGYKKPDLRVENVSGRENYEEHYRLTTPIAQSVVDLLVEHELHVGLLVRERAVIKVIVRVHSHFGSTFEEVSASDLDPDEVKVQRIGEHALLRR